MAEVDTQSSASSKQAPRSDDAGAQWRRFENVGTAHNELISGFNEWSGSLRTYGVQVAYAVIAANWAIHGTAQTLLSNSWAKWSMIVAVGYLAIHLVCAGWMTWMYRRRCSYADQDKARWVREFNQHAAAGSSWPYTTLIEKLGGGMRVLHVVGPLLSGVFLIVSMFNR